MILSFLFLVLALLYVIDSLDLSPGTQASALLSVLIVRYEYRDFYAVVEEEIPETPKLAVFLDKSDALYDGRHDVLSGILA